MKLDMTTTLTVSSETHRKLEMLKNEKDADSFDELLEEVAEKELELPSTEEMFGSVKGMKKGEIRDHEDRTERYD